MRTRARNRGLARPPRRPRTQVLALTALLIALIALIASPSSADGAYPDVMVSVSGSPGPGDDFTVIFRVTSHQTANYTVTVQPRPEFAFTDNSSGVRTLMIPDGATVEVSFPMTVSRSAAEGEYLFSYSVEKDGATVTIDTFTVKVGRMPCTFGIALPASLMLCAAALVRVRGEGRCEARTEGWVRRSRQGGGPGPPVFL
ncbi:MAG: hypothetical protein ACUVV6_07795 [Thermoplasmatota archaeon]